MMIIKNYKKIILAVFFLSIVALGYSILSSYAQTNYVGTSEWYKDYEYTLSSSNKTITLTKFNGSASEVIVPPKATINNVKYQTIIGPGVYYNNDVITSVVFQNGVKAGPSLLNLFRSCSNLTSIDFNNFDTSETTNMGAMFNGVSKIENLDLSSFDTTNVTSMSGIMSTASLKTLDISSFDTTNVTTFGNIALGDNIQQIKIGPKTDFRLDYQKSWGGFTRGTWVRTSDNKEFDAIDIARRSSTENMAGTYRKISNNIESMNIKFPVTYSIGDINKIDRYETSNMDIEITDNKNIFIKNITKPTVSDYRHPGSLTLYFDDVVTDINGNVYNFKMTIDNIHFYDINKDNNLGLNRFVYRLLSFDKKLVLQSYFFDNSTDLNKVYTEPSSFDVTFEITNDDGEPVDNNGHYIFSAYDLDIGSNKDSPSPYDNFPDTYGNYSEGVNLLEGFDTNTITMVNNSYLKYFEENNNRILGTHVDGGSELSEFLVQGNANKTKFTWTGENCGTRILSQYQPKKIVIDKQDIYGNSLQGAKLNLYYGDELLDSWMTTGEEREMFLMPGDYTLKEDIAPDGYTTSEDIRFSVGANIIVNGQVKEKVIMTDRFQSYPYQIQHVEQGNVSHIFQSTTGTAHYGDSIDVEEESITGYTYVSKSKNKIIINSDEDNNIAYVYYKKANYNYTVNYYDINTDELIKSEIKSSTYNSVINARDEVIDIDNYSFVSSDKDNITIGTNSNNNVLNLYYEKKKSTITVHHYLQGTTTKIADDEIIQKNYGDEYSTSKKTFDNYEYVSVEGNTNGTVNKDNIVVTYYYKLKTSQITVHHYLQGTTTKLSEDEIIPKNYGDNYSTSKKTLDNYEYVSVEGNPSGTVNQDNIIVTYYYKLKTSQITVHHYLQGTTTKIADDEIIQKNYGAEYNTSKKTLDNYEYVSVEGTPSGTVNQDTIIVTYYYKLKTSQITVHHYLQGTTTKLADDEIIQKNYGEEYNTSKKTLDNYEYVSVEGDPSGTVNKDNIVVTYYYKAKNAQLIVKYLDKDTNQALANEYSKNYHYGDTYEAPETSISQNYNLDSISGDVSGIINKDLTTVIYYYKKKPSNISDNLVKTGTEKVTSSSDIVDYKISYEAKLTDYIGSASVKVLDELPYPIDEEKSNLDGGLYNKQNNTIVWEINYDEFNSYDNDTIKITKNLKIAYKDLTKVKSITNNVHGSIKLDNNESSILKTKTTDVAIPGTVTVKYIDENGKELSDMEVIKGLVGDTIDTKAKDIKGYSLYEKPDKEVITLKEGNIDVVYKYKLLKFNININISF